MDNLEIQGGVWRVAGVQGQPSLTLVRWQVLELPSGERHFSGWAVQNREGRASTAIRTFDAAAMRGITTSGRIYELKGPPGPDTQGEYVWAIWARINSQPVWSDVTAEVWSAHLALAATGEEEA